MRKYTKTLPTGETIFVGLDLHNQNWHVTIRTADVQFSSASIAGNWQSLRALLSRYPRPTHPSRL